ncbi:Membrane [Seminavis robusta]|uniref:Membrane n=1 Tax=Seminavis robusta TaxID=568900 RepID=A0A9N8E0C3_9STRA|nr:Membrane [Seminavis robusta]|eukprot:Sro499_g154990.1 Membrane (621) ;mRNA; r:7940-9802
MKLGFILSSLACPLTFASAAPRALQFDEGVELYQAKSNGSPGSNGNGPPDHVFEKFRARNHLKPGANPFLQQLDADAPSVDVGGETVSLDDGDLEEVELFAKHARLLVDGSSVSGLPKAFRSKSDDSIVITKSSNGALVSVSKKGSAKVVPVGHDNYYATIEADDVDEDSVGDLYFEDPPTIPDQRSLRRAFPSSGVKHQGSRQLNSCASFKYIDIGVYVDSYMCENEGSAQAAYNAAAAIVQQASQHYEEICYQLVISDMFVYCSGDIMRSSIDSLGNSICEGTVLDDFRGFLRDGNSNIPNGDIVHLFSGRDYPNNSRCVGQAYVGAACAGSGYRTGINEMSGWTTNDILLAHESGHNLGAPHESGIMQGSICGSCSFSSSSEASINSYVAGVSCISSNAPNGPEPTPPPTEPPTSPPTNPPTAPPTSPPTNPPTAPPTNPPTEPPTPSPTESPTEPPTPSPTDPPTEMPTDPPTDPPTPGPPTSSPTDPPTNAPTPSPTEPPTEPPTPSPTESPTEPPTPLPTDPPTEPPTPSPTDPPTLDPTEAPTDPPTPLPTESPTEPPTPSPTEPPTESPTPSPTIPCGVNKATCNADSECCSGKCNQGTCRGNRRRLGEPFF